MKTSKLLREFIRILLIEESKSATLSGQNLDDIGQAINWLKLNGYVKNAGSHSKKKDGKHQVSMKFKGSKKELIDFVKSRFGSFVDVN